MTVISKYRNSRGDLYKNLVIFFIDPPFWFCKFTSRADIFSKCFNFVHLKTRQWNLFGNSGSDSLFDNHVIFLRLSLSGFDWLWMWCFCVNERLPCLVRTWLRLAGFRSLLRLLSRIVWQEFLATFHGVPLRWADNGLRSDPWKPRID